MMMVGMRMMMGVGMEMVEMGMKMVKYLSRVLVQSCVRTLGMGMKMVEMGMRTEMGIEMKMLEYIS